MGHSASPHIYAPTWARRCHVEGKVRAIEAAVAAADVPTLRQLAATPWGLFSNELRERAWPLLLGLGAQPRAPGPVSSHGDEGQVALDVARSFNHFPFGLGEAQRETLRGQLTATINSVLGSHQDLCYYQGYHDLCSVFLLVLGPTLAPSCLERVSCNHIRAYHAPSIRGATRHLSLLPPLLGLADKPLAAALTRAGIDTMPHFALAWVLTWYSHVLHDLQPMARLADIFLAYPHPLLPVYVAAALVMRLGPRLLTTPPEFCAMFTILSNIPKDLAVDPLVLTALQLYDEHPPDTLRALTKLDIIGTSASLSQYPYPWLASDHPLPATLHPSDGQWMETDKKETDTVLDTVCGSPPPLSITSGIVWLRQHVHRVFVLKHVLGLGLWALVTCTLHVASPTPPP